MVSYRRLVRRDYLLTRKLVAEIAEVLDGVVSTVHVPSESPYSRDDRDQNESNCSFHYPSGLAFNLLFLSRTCTAFLALAFRCSGVIFAAAKPPL